MEDTGLGIRIHVLRGGEQNEETPGWALGCPGLRAVLWEKSEEAEEMEEMEEAQIKLLHRHHWQAVPQGTSRGTL